MRQLLIQGWLTICECKITNYKDLSDRLRLPRWRRSIKEEQKLYPVEVLEENEENQRVKVHYLGYGDEHEEWVKNEDTVTLEPQGEFYP